MAVVTTWKGREYLQSKCTYGANAVVLEKDVIASGYAPSRSSSCALYSVRGPSNLCLRRPNQTTEQLISCLLIDFTEHSCIHTTLVFRSSHQ